MKPETLAAELRRMKTETGSLQCLGCGHEHNCGVHGCALIRAAADELEQLNDFAQSQMHALLESLTAANRRIADLQAERDAAIDHVRSAEGCWGCKFAVDGAACRCEDCDIDDDCNENCPWWGNPCGLCEDGDNWIWAGVPKEVQE